MRVRKRLKKLLGLEKWYGQSEEDKIIAEYFGDFKGMLLSIGENDGHTLSNVLYFIKKGWKGDLIEPSPKAFAKLVKRHHSNPNVQCHLIAIVHEHFDGGNTGILYESGELMDLGDTSLVSSLFSDQSYQYPDVKFKPVEVPILSFCNFFQSKAKYRKYDLISIDAENWDYDILQGMDLNELGCRCLIVEHSEQIEMFKSLVLPQGYKVLHVNKENIIFVKE